MACSRAKLAVCVGLFARRARWVAALLEGGAVIGFLVGDTAAVRPGSIIFVGTLDGTVSALAGVRTGEASVGLVIAGNDEESIGGYGDVCARCGYDGKAVRSLGGQRSVASPNELVL